MWRNPSKCCYFVFGNWTMLDFRFLNNAIFRLEKTIWTGFINNIYTACDNSPLADIQTQCFLELENIRVLKSRDTVTLFKFHHINGSSIVLFKAECIKVAKIWTMLPISRDKSLIVNCLRVTHYISTNRKVKQTQMNKYNQDILSLVTPCS